MGVRTAYDRDPAGLRSDIYWAILGLIIERPSYGYELVHRYERTFGDLLPLSSQGQIYKGLDSLEEKALIEKVPEPGSERQPKTNYRATSLGVELYQERIIARAAEESRRSQAFGHELAILPPGAALVVLDSYEKACLAEAERKHGSKAGSDRVGDRASGDSRAGGDPIDSSASLARRLAAEDTRWTLQAKLSWIEGARHQIRAMLETPSEPR